MSPSQRTVFAILAAVIAVVAVILLAGSGGGDDDERAATAPTTATQTTPEPVRTATVQTTPTPAPTPTPTPEPAPAIDYAGGEVEGGVAQLDFDQGEQVRFSVTSDVADEVHVHGYDLTKDVTAGGTVRFAFPASIEGVFEVELESLGQQLAELRVNPS